MTELNKCEDKYCAVNAKELINCAVQVMTLTKTTLQFRSTFAKSMHDTQPKNDNLRWFAWSKLNLQHQYVRFRGSHCFHSCIIT